MGVLLKCKLSMCAEAAYFQVQDLDACFEHLSSKVASSGARLIALKSGKTSRDKSKCKCLGKRTGACTLRSNGKAKRVIYCKLAVCVLWVKSLSISPPHCPQSVPEIINS